MSVINKEVKNGMSLDEFDSECFSINDKITNVDGINDQGSKITTFYCDIIYKYTFEKEDGTLYEKKDKMLYELPECTISIPEKGFSTNIKQTTRENKKTKKTENITIRKTDCFGNFNIQDPNIAKHIKIGPPKLIKVKGEEDDESGQPIPKGCVTCETKPILDDEGQDTGEIGYITCKEKDIKIVPVGYKIQKESFDTKLKKAISKAVLANKKNLGALSTFDKNKIHGKIKNIFRLGDLNGSPDDENTNFDCKFSLIDKNEPGSYNRIETEFKFPNGINYCDENGNPIKLTYEHLRGWNIKGFGLAETRQLTILAEGDIFFKPKILSFVITKIEKNVGEADQSLTQERLADQVDAISLQDAIANVINASNKRKQIEKKEEDNKLNFTVSEEIRKEEKVEKVNSPDTSETKTFPAREQKAELSDNEA